MGNMYEYRRAQGTRTRTVGLHHAAKYSTVQYSTVRYRYIITLCYIGYICF